MNINQLNAIYNVLEVIKGQDVSLQAAFKISNLNKAIKEQIEIFTEFSKNKEPETWTELYKELTEIVAAHEPTYKENFNILSDNFYQLGFQKDAEEGYEKIKTLISEKQLVIDEKLKSLKEINEAAASDIEVEIGKISINTLPATLKPIEFETIRPIIAETDEEIAKFFEG